LHHSHQLLPVNADYTQPETIRGQLVAANHVADSVWVHTDKVGGILD
jgi:hypothetical protein